MKLKLIKIIFLSLLFLLITPVFAFASLSTDSTPSGESVREMKKDHRISSLRKFLETYNSPLAPFAKDFVVEADANKLDWRLVAAISGVESTFGQFLPKNSYNAWGWGIYGDNMFYFPSYPEAIKTISKGLRENYINKWGAKDTYEIGRFYAASPTWAQRVERFMSKIDDFASKNPGDTLSISL